MSAWCVRMVAVSRATSDRRRDAVSSSVLEGRWAPTPPSKNWRRARSTTVSRQATSPGGECTEAIRGPPQQKTCRPNPQRPFTMLPTPPPPTHCLSNSLSRPPSASRYWSAAWKAHTKTTISCTHRRATRVVHCRHRLQPLGGEGGAASSLARTRQPQHRRVKHLPSPLRLGSHAQGRQQLETQP